jgi:hypothetical protein
VTNCGAAIANQNFSAHFYPGSGAAKRSPVQRRDWLRGQGCQYV